IDLSRMIPKELRYKRATLNIKCNDERYFIWCILAAIHSVNWTKHPERVSHYNQYQDELDEKGLDFPILKVRQIDKFEKRNQLISINIFRWSDNKVVPYRITDELHRRHHINLLQLKKKYLLIRDFNR